MRIIVKRKDRLGTVRSTNNGLGLSGECGPESRDSVSGQGFLEAGCHQGSARFGARSEAPNSHTAELLGRVPDGAQGAGKHPESGARIGMWAVADLARCALPTANGSCSSPHDVPTRTR